MPNWCVNELNISGEEAAVDAVYEHFVEDKDGEKVFEFSFSKVVPLPKDLADAKSDGHLGYTICHTDGWKALRAYDWVKVNLDDPRTATREDVLAAVAIHRKVTVASIIAEADADKLRLDKYGYMDWYKWSIDNWGTKWDACSADLRDGYGAGDGDLVIKFDTAWSPPKALIAAMAEKFPDVDVTLSYYEPGMCFCGTLYYSEGELADDSSTEIPAGLRPFLQERTMVTNELRASITPASLAGWQHLDDATVEQVSEIIDNMNDDEFNKFMNNSVRGEARQLNGRVLVSKTNDAGSNPARVTCPLHLTTYTGAHDD